VLTLSVDSVLAADVVEEIESLAQDLARALLSHGDEGFRVVVVQNCELDRHADLLVVVFVDLVEGSHQSLARIGLTMKSKSLKDSKLTRCAGRRQSLFCRRHRGFLWVPALTAYSFPLWLKIIKIKL